MLTKVLEVELTEAIEEISLDDKYLRCRILVRHDKVPLGWITFSTKNKKTFSGDDLTEIIKKQLGQSIVNHFLNKNIQSDPGSVVSAPVSVVVCTRNRTDYLKHCLQALLQLNYPVFEIIVVDNAPVDDETKNMVASLPVLYVREDRPGLDWARNRGIKEAKYSLVAFTDDDAKVDAFWLYAINQAFLNPSIMAVSGLVAPAELETSAQHIFELGYGGMGHGYSRKYFSRKQISNQRLLQASSFGIGANMAFRKEVFEKVGYFDVAFDVGTPTNGGGDVEMFFRLVNSGYTMQYEPSMLIWHTHRRDMKALEKQIRDNGRSIGCFLTHLYWYKQVRRITILKFFLVSWLWKWNLKNFIKPRKHLPRRFSLFELQGLITSPFAYRASRKIAARYKGQEEPLHFASSKSEKIVAY